MKIKILHLIQRPCAQSARVFTKFKNMNFKIVITYYNQIKSFRVNKS